MKSFLSKNKWKLLLAFVIFIVLIPLAINALFKIAAPLSMFAAEWEAGDALAFYGAMLASATTIVGVYVSVEYAQRNYRQDEVNKVKPYFALTHYKSSTKVNFLSVIGLNQENEETEEKSKDSYEEYRLDKVFIVIEETGVKYQNDLTKAQKERLESGGLETCAHSNGCRTVQAHPFYSMPFEIENVGSGAATNTKITLNRKGNRRIGVDLYTIKQNDSFYCHIFCDQVEAVAGQEYMLELIYDDVLGNQYIQKYPTRFYKNDEIDKYCVSVNLNGAQKIRNTSTEEETNG